MDIEKILNNVVFNYGWGVDSDFILFGKNNSIKIIFDSYDENELINHIQKNCLNQLNEKESEYSNIVISLLKTYIVENKISIETKNIENEINLTSILITQEGDVLFLFEVNWDIENGLCIKVIPEYDIGPQDVFL
jgi:hypothetical protein